jgi:alpha-pyrone synthase
MTHHLRWASTFDGGVPWFLMRPREELRKVPGADFLLLEPGDATREGLMTHAYLNRIGTAVPEYDIHRDFFQFAERSLSDPRAQAVFRRLAAKSTIEHRYSCLQPGKPLQEGATDVYEFYQRGMFPSTGQRMQLFERYAPTLARRALDSLSVSPEERSVIHHVLVTCCTGLYAPGLDFEVADYLGLGDAVERAMIGFMGCYAAINALRVARHIVRSAPDESVLILNLELCTLHLHETRELKELLPFLLFADGAAASLVSSKPVGLEIESFRTMQMKDTRDLITWRVGDLGFDMLLSDRVPGSIATAMRESRTVLTSNEAIDRWAVHPGGRSILDSVEEGLALKPEALQASRKILSSFGNMSSATVMFVLQELMKENCSGQKGLALSFGPGLTAEMMSFYGV